MKTVVIVVMQPFLKSGRRVSLGKGGLDSWNEVELFFLEKVMSV